MSFNDVFGLIIFGMLLLAVAAALVQARRTRHRHQIRTTMRRKHNIKILVDNCLSVDVSTTNCQPKVWADVALNLDGFTVKGDITMFTYFTDQRIKGEITPKDDMQHPAGWEDMHITISDPTLGTISPLAEDANNPLKFQIESPRSNTFDWGTNQNPRPFTVSIDFDGKVGEDVVPVHIEINGELAQRTATAAGTGVSLSQGEDWAPSGE